MYIVIDKEWLEKNLNMLEEHYQTRINDDSSTKRILIDDAIEYSKPKVEGCGFRDVFIKEKTDHIDVSLTSEVPLDVVVRLIDNWKKKIEPFTDMIKGGRQE